MNEERFEIFLKDYYDNQNKYFNEEELDLIKPFIFKLKGIFVAGNYYKENYKNIFFITLKNNAYKEHIEAVVKQEEMSEDVLLKTTFYLVSYKGINPESIYTLNGIFTEYLLITIVPKKIAKGGKYHLQFEEKTDINNKLLLKSKYLYKDMRECAENFKFVKRLINILAEKYAKKDSLDILKNICEGLNVSEQTMYSWKRKNKNIFKAMKDGYFFTNIEEILRILSIVPIIQKDTWNYDEEIINPYRVKNELYSAKDTRGIKQDNKESLKNKK